MGAGGRVRSSPLAHVAERSAFPGSNCHRRGHPRRCARQGQLHWTTVRLNSMVHIIIQGHAWHGAPTVYQGIQAAPDPAEGSGTDGWETTTRRCNVMDWYLNRRSGADETFAGPIHRQPMADHRDGHDPPWLLAVDGEERLSQAAAF